MSRDYEICEADPYLLDTAEKVAWALERWDNPDAPLRLGDHVPIRPVSNVVQLRPEPTVLHLSGTAQCFACQHRWEAVAPVGTVELECPTCGLNTGRFRNLIEPGPGESFWECGCGCSIFSWLKDRGMMCLRCGEYQRGF